MKIPENVLQKWLNLRSRGDNNKIMEKNEGITNADVSRAINTGECSDNIFFAIADFYKEKEELVKSYSTEQ